MTYIDYVLINFSRYLLFGVYFTLHQKSILSKYILKGKPIMKQKQRDIDFHVSDIDAEKFCCF